MQTFLPFPSIRESLNCLDNKRLGKQRVEAMQIINCLRKPNRWINHPAVKMWAGFEDSLSLYMNEAIRQWTNRGFNNTMKLVDINPNSQYPPWFGDDRFHRSHRANLLRKDFSHYSKFWREDVNLPYFWPTKEGY